MENKDYSELIISNSKESMNNNYAYNVLLFSDSLTNESFGVLRKSEELTHGVDINNSLSTKYIRCYTQEDDSVLIPVKNKNEEISLNKYKFPNQNYKEIQLTISNPESCSEYNISIFFASDSTIFIKPADVKALRQTSPAVLRKALINSIYDNCKFSGVSRKRTI